MPEEVAEGKLTFKPDSKTRQFYGVIGIAEYNDGLLAELKMGWDVGEMTYASAGSKRSVNPEHW